MKYEKVYFKTSNINLAATLHTLNFPIDGIYQADNSEVVEFYFNLIPELEKTVDDFWNRRLKIEPHSLLIVRKELIESIKNKQYEKKDVKE